ncbi:hypothetical protein KGQ20_18115 [Catenulispora sp. NF23]|uniref:Uncharacterized protein n=1 Tax=Catenulispora pinistramenti TaxID=2705254 RepID=A0ABS5KYQ0_9ACTN|nr:hypothetical protein [Catenulispora pinistramenti]MBS2534690.1 hypothetical protein [Catenulispora pinistramenti]MBS2551197.1 hypothetical protein [Catenulispora pinistramenti]
MGGFKKVLIGCGVLAGIVVAGFVGDVAWYFHSLGPGSQPDVLKAARSAPTQAADQAVTAQVDSRTGQLRAALPWATYLGTAVEDVCKVALAPDGSFGAKQSWLPVTCTRTDTVYEAFDGDFRQHLVQLDGVLGKAGWRSTDLPPMRRQGEQPSLAGWFDYDHTPPSDPDPSQIAAAAAFPNVVRLGYDVPVTEDFAPPKGLGPHLPHNGTVEVSQAPRLPTLDGGQGDHDLMLKYPSVTTSYFRAWQPYNRTQVAAAYPAHGAVIAIALSVSYGTGG